MVASIDGENARATERAPVAGHTAGGTAAAGTGALCRGNNTEIDGPEVILSAEAGQTLAMVLHELATNAAKHGAFSSREGKVSVDWRRQLNGNARAGLVIEWQETGGPPAKAESKAGYGISIICELIPHELAGKVNHVLTPEGARCQLEIPGRWIDASSPG